MESYIIKVIGEVLEELKEDFNPLNEIEKDILYYEHIELKSPFNTGFSKKEALERAEDYYRTSPKFSNGKRPFCIVAKYKSRFYVYSTNTYGNALKINRSIINKGVY